MNNDPRLGMANRQSNITIVYQSGIMAQVAYVDGALQLLHSLPDKYKGTTSGLLGVWNDDIGDDLMTPGGEIIDYTQGNQFIHNNFGETWFVTDTSSRFRYRGSMSAAKYHDANFIPHFTEPALPPNSSLTETEVDAACGTNFVCRFDYKTTLSRNLAVTSSEIQTWTADIVTKSQPVASCSYLDIPYSRREVTHYMEGGTVTLTGCTEGYTLQGNIHYTCVVTDNVAQWQPSVDSLCKSDVQISAEQQDLALMIAIPICIIAVVIGLSVGGFFLYKHKKKGKKPGGESAPRSSQFAYSNGSLPGSPVTLTPVPRPQQESVLLHHGQVQHNTLAGSADIGSMNSFASSDHIDTTLQVGAGPLTPNGIIDNSGVSMSPEPQYSHINKGSRENVHLSRYESTGFQPIMKSLSGSKEEINYFPPPTDFDPNLQPQMGPNHTFQPQMSAEPGYTEIPADVSHQMQHSHTFDSSMSQGDITQVKLHQSQLSQSQLQLHPEPCQSPPQLGISQDLIKLGESATNINRNSLPRESIQQSQLNLSAAKLSQSQRSLHQSTHSLVQPQMGLYQSTHSISQSQRGLHPSTQNLSQSQTGINQPAHSLSQANQLTSAHGYTNLAASIHSINTTTPAAIQPTASSHSFDARIPASVRASQASLHGGQANLAMSLDEDQTATQADTPANRFAAYASTYGTDTQV